MELALSLGDVSEFLEQPKSTRQDQKPAKINAPDFCMALGLTRSSPENITQEIDEHGYHRENLQLNLLPVNPIRSFENRSSTPAAEEASSANSDIRSNRNKASDDEEENGINARKKLRLSKQQSAFLEDNFKEHSTLNHKHKHALAKQLNLRPRQVEVWFQNRRARTKLKQTEVDCEYLKRCCATLTEENLKLQKELQELRALKISNPFHMQPPATTLTMCPSCERVATGATKKDTVPFPLTRPRFYPFSKAPTRPNNQSAAS